MINSPYLVVSQGGVKDTFSSFENGVKYLSWARTKGLNVELFRTEDNAVWNDEVKEWQKQEV